MFTIVSFLAKLGIGSIVGQLTDAYQAREKAKTDREVIAADERIKGLQARRDVMIAESNTPINAIIRALFALPVAVYYGKIFLWDKVLAMGATDALSTDLLHVSWVIIGFYFLTEATTKMTRKR